MSVTKKKSAVKKPESATEAKKTTNPEVQGQHTERTSDDLPSISKQTAGGIGGALVGGVVGGPIGALVGGVAGAMIGNASAAGERPIGRTVDGIKAVAEEPARKAYARISKAVSPRADKKTGAVDAADKKTPAKKSSANTAAIDAKTKK